MAVLTERHVRQLLKSTDYQQTKQLILEPGTIITPSAKSYLTNVVVVYQDERVDSVSQDVESIQPSKPPTRSLVKANRVSLKWQLAVDRTIVNLLNDQHYLKDDQETITAIQSIVDGLSQLRKLATVRLDESDLVSPNLDAAFSQDSFIPTYQSGETALRFFERYLDLGELKLAVYDNWLDYLDLEECQLLAKSCQVLVDRMWLLMVNQLKITQ